MKTSLESQILLRCPIIYRGRFDGPKNNLTCFGFECGDGWFQIIYELSVSIEDIAHQLKLDGISEQMLPCVVQVKEKFGGLRFYINNYFAHMDNLIDAAEALSFQTCDMCGEPGKRRYVNDWLRTNCDACAAKQSNKNGGRS